MHVFRLAALKYQRNLLNFSNFNKLENRLLFTFNKKNTFSKLFNTKNSEFNRAVLKRFNSSFFAFRTSSRVFNSLNGIKYNNTIENQILRAYSTNNKHLRGFFSNNDDDEDDSKKNNKSQDENSIEDDMDEFESTEPTDSSVSNEVGDNSVLVSSPGIPGGIQAHTIQTPEMTKVIPIYRRPIFPGVVAPVLVSDSNFLKSLTEYYKAEERAFRTPLASLMLVKSEIERSEQSEIHDINQLYDVGVLAQIHTILPRGDGTAHVFVGGIRRVVRTSELIDPMMVNIKEFKDEEYDKKSDVIKAYAMEIISTVREIVAIQPFFKKHLSGLLEIGDMNNPSVLADFGATITSAEPSELQEVLGSSNIEVRLSKSLSLLKRELDLSKLGEKIRNQLDEKLSSTQRKFFLMEQLKLIKQELGMDKDEKESIITKFRSRMKKLKLPKDPSEVIEEELAKLSTLEAASSEYNVTRNYLDWLTLLPWGIYTKDQFDLARAMKILDRDHHGLKDIKNRILEFIAVGKIRGSVHGKILCFVGPPGTGKTSVGKSIANALGRKFYRFSVGGMNDVAEIKGHRRTYVGAMPGKFLQCLKYVKSANPVILIDEIDKMSRSNIHGDPSSALLEALDPEQNSTFVDNYLDVPLDLSKVLFLCTANVLETIPEPLLDRMEVLRLSGYVLEEKMAIARKYLWKQARKEAGLKASQASIDKKALQELCKSYAREAGVRNLQKYIEKIVRKISLQIAKGESESVSVTSDSLSNLIGPPVFTSDRFYERTLPGVVMGLAWTSMGGATLYIEAISTGLNQGGSGSLRLTGMAGDVMKESSEIALSYAKTHADQLIDSLNNNDSYSNIKPFERFSKSDYREFLSGSSIHMHIPEGATSKDGPSAGVTMVTSLLSLAMDKPVLHNLAMTGEITLTGKVLPIGGVKEKLIAARRSGAKIIILPKGNLRDYEELEDNLKNGLQIHFVDYYPEVFEIAFGKKKPLKTNSIENKI